MARLDLEDDDISDIAKSELENYKKEDDPIFDNIAEYYHRLVQPSASRNLLYTEINEDVVLSNLDEDNIQIVQMVQSINLDLQNAFSKVNRKLTIVNEDKKSKSVYFIPASLRSFIGEMMVLVNARKALQGNYAKGVFHLNSEKNINITTDNKKKRVV